MNDEVKFHEFVTIVIAICIAVLSFPHFISAFVSFLDVIDSHEGVAQVLVAVTTAFFAYWIPSRYRQRDKKNIMLSEIYRHNESVVYAGILAETAIAIAERVVGAYHMEESLLKQMKLGIHPNENGYVPTYIGILPFMISDVGQAVSKMKDAGKHFDVVLAFMRLDHHIKQFDLTANERLDVLRHKEGRLSGMVKESLFAQNFNRLNDLTQGLLLSVEAILDHSLYVLIEMNKISKEEKSNSLKEGNLVGVCVWQENYLYDEMRLELREILDRIPRFNPRHLYLPAMKIF